MTAGVYIVKTRQIPMEPEYNRENQKVNRKEVGKPRGIINSSAGREHIEHRRLAPVSELGEWIEHFWSVRWRLPAGVEHRAEVLPHPSVHLIFEIGQTRIMGVQRGKFSRLLENRGRVLGVKFKPGAFYPFIKYPVAKFTDSFIAPGLVFGETFDALEATVLGEQDKSQNGRPLEPDEIDEIHRRSIETFLLEHKPASDLEVNLAGEIVELIRDTPGVYRVEDIVERLDLSKRKVQRLFRDYVGVSPKWVIKRYRLHEALERVQAGGFPDWPSLALDLGYADQAHFIKDFKGIVGTSPGQYARQNKTSTNPG